MSPDTAQVSELTIDSWKDILELAYAEQKFVYRGQMNAEWSLQTSLERACHRLDHGLERAGQREENLLREFRRRYHQYSVDSPVSDDTLEWLSLMQHHGAPTRLLDWTYSVPVAMFFALADVNLNGTESAAVWRFNEKWCQDESEKAFSGTGSRSEFFKKNVENSPPGEFHEVFMASFQWDGIALVNPFRLNVRLRNQQGVFTSVANVKRSYMENLRSFSGWQDNVTKIIIKPKLFREILFNLAKMNVTHATLFPGLDGFARGLGVWHPILWG